MDVNKFNETKICSKCGRRLPLEAFRQLKNPQGKRSYRAECRECEKEYDRQYKLRKKKKNAVFDDDIQMFYKREYKEIKPERILDLAQTGIDIVLAGTDEIFVKLMDYKETWFSNYGRMIRKSYGKYNLLNGTYLKNRGLRYSVRKNVFVDGKWIDKQDYLYASQTAIDTFIVNPDKANNIFIWHSGFDKEDNYYRNLYPLTQEQYRIVKEHYLLTGEDSEEYILKVMNDVRFKTSDWTGRVYKPIMGGIGYYGCNDADVHSEAYVKWKNMINRCYNAGVQRRSPQYEGCAVCEEWKSFSNFREWYKNAKYGNKPLDLDKDILFKGNKIYSPDTCCLVPKVINTLFTNGKAHRGELPLGVYAEENNNKTIYIACMSVGEKRIKIKRCTTPEDAFRKYKEYKEKFIKNMANKYKDKIPAKVYEAMMDWEIEITD
ncbi:MAG: hypothetical protein Q4F11_10085 [Eubacteriales bacterium]|nr:hypothetical protein [Eubacteriales bacterium]